MKVRKTIVVIPIIIIMLISVFLFAHSTPQRTIKSNLFIEGHFINSFKTTVFFNGHDQYGDRYSCKDPAIGSDFYSVEKKSIVGLNYWYITSKGGA